MSEFPLQQSASAPLAIAAWSSDWPRKNSSEDYMALQDKYAPFTKGNELFTIPKAVEKISLLSTNVSTWQFLGISRELME